MLNKHYSKILSVGFVQSYSTFIITQHIIYSWENVQFDIQFVNMKHFKKSKNFNM